MAAESLPDWVQWLGALAPAITGTVTAVVAVAVAVVAYRQWRLARDKLVLDLFDKRMAIFSGTMEASHKAMLFGLDGTAGIEVSQAMLEAWWQSEFLFGPEVRDKLEELVDVVVRVTRNRNKDVDDPADFIEPIAEIERLRGELPPLFAPYMRMDHRRS